MKYCSNCGNQLRDEAKFCDKCGAAIETSTPTKVPPSPSPLPQKKKKKSKESLLVIFVIIIAIFILYSLSKQKPDSTSDYQPTSNYNIDTRTSKYVHNTVNVREGRGINFKIVGKLNRGEKVKVDSLERGWYTVYDSNDDKIGYVSSELLKDNPIPPFEIVSWNWRQDPDFGTNGTIIFTVEVRNNTNKYVSSLRVDFATYDKNDNVMASTFTYVNGLQPGGTSTESSYATYYGNEQTARIRIDPNQIY